MKTLYERLAYDGSSDFLKITRAYLIDDSNDYVRDIRNHFNLVINGDPRYLNHGPVLALSVGGSNTKLMIAETRDGFIHVRHIRGVKNPVKETHFYDFLEELLIKNKAVYAYLKETAKPVMSIVLPVMIGADGIPQHPKKIPTVTGMLARSEADMVEDMNLDNNMGKYFRSRGIQMPLLYYQPDPVIAHLGGVSQIDLKPGERTFLLVCGTGMATADDNTSRTLSRTPVMDHDEELYPADQTEGYLYESGCSGLLLYGVMRRAIQIREREEGSLLKDTGASDYFQSSDDSELVCRIWETIFEPGLNHPKLNHIRAAVPPKAFFELQKIAELLMQRLHGTLANAILATAVKINEREFPSRYHVIFEGSAALNRRSLPLIFQEMNNRLAHSELFRELGVAIPDIDPYFRQRKKVFFDESIPQSEREKMEISLVGTAVAAITHSVLHE
ncbi:MAG: hypothetical protein LBQ55_10515 [Treponema sp.]|nr:hypothetical protein [Treponema sp.]